MIWKSYLSRSAIAQSPSVRQFLLLGTAITIAILLWTREAANPGYRRFLTPIYFLFFTLQDHTGAIAMLVALLSAALIPRSSRTSALVQWAGNNPLRLAAAATLVLMLGALLVYRNHPLSMDEYTAYFQGQVFAAGHLTGSLPVAQMDWLIPPGFQNAFINVSHVTGRAISGYWPSFSILLAPFDLIGAPWACNPVITGLTLLAIHRLALEIFDDAEAAGMAALLTAASPAIFAYGISYYAMQAHLLANALYALLLLHPTVHRAILAGIVGSIALTLHNPVPHILFCLPWLVWLMSRPRGLMLLVSAATGYLPLCLLLGFGWHWFSGQLIHAGLNGAEVAIGMTGNQQNLALIFHFPTLRALALRLMDLAKLWTWAVPGLLILAITGAWRRRHNPTCMLLAVSAATTFAGYLFFPYDQGHGWGARYLHSAWLALPLLATAAWYSPVSSSEQSHDLPAQAAVTKSESEWSRVYMTHCILLALVCGVGLRAWQIHDFMSLQLANLPHYGGTERRVTFLDYKGQQSLKDYFTSYYSGDLVQNDPWLRNQEIRMFSQGEPDDSEMMSQFYPGFHLVYQDGFGSVWSQAAAPGTAEPAP